MDKKSDKPPAFRVVVGVASDTSAAKLRTVVEAAGFKPGFEEGQIEWVLSRLTESLSVYLFMTGLDRDTPEGERRLHQENLRKAREENPQFKYADLPPVVSEGKHLAGFIKAVTAAREHWSALSGEIQVDLGLSPFEIRQHGTGATEIVPVDPLQAIIERAQRVKKERTGGRPKQEALNTLLHTITVQWRSAFDPDPANNPFLGIVRHGAAKERSGDDAQIYSGGLLDFASEVLKSQGIDGGTSSALGRRLYDLVTKTWQMSRHESPPKKAN